MLAVAIAGACGPSGDPLQIRYVFATSGEDSCGPDAECDDIARSCDSVMMLRIVDPDRPEIAPYSECREIPNFQPNLCPIISAGFNAMGSIPTERAEVQIAIYPRTALEPAPPAPPICPAMVKFTATGFAHVDNEPDPALAGRGFAEGDENEVTVVLGCNDKGLIDTEECRNEREIDITATVIDFETQLSVSTGVASNLIVHAGEPHQSDLEWVIDTGDTIQLLGEESGTLPFWYANDVPLGTLPGQIEFNELACTQVIEPGRPASLTCYDPAQPLPTAIDLGGVLVRRPTLDAALAALGLTEFPSICPLDCGLLLGVVVDETGQGVGGAVVSDSATPVSSEVRYLSEDRTSVTTTPPTASHGIFLSRTAEIIGPDGPNTWSVAAPLMQLNNPVGGIVSNRLSVVVIRVQTP